MRGTNEVSLPAELWIEIFNKINSFQQLMQCSLVSSRWKLLANTVMFNRDITMVTEQEAMIFYNYLRDSPEKNQLVKHLTMMPKNQSLDYFREIIPLVITRNMKTLNGSVDGTLFFRVLLFETFGKKGIRKFRNLRTVPSAWTYNNIYDRLLNRLRYTLEHITLNFRGIYYDKSLKWKTLYRLDKMAQLRELTFNSYVHNVERTEAILKNCSHLKRLTIHLAVEDLFSGEADVNQWIKINTHQCNTLRELKIRVDMEYNPYLVDYLMYKYPSVESIILEKADIEEPWGLYPVYPMDISTIRSALDKIQRVPNYTLKYKVSLSKVDSIISTLKSDGYVVFKGDQDILTSIVTVTNSNPNHSILSSTSRSTVLSAPLRICYPSIYS